MTVQWLDFIDASCIPQFRSASYNIYSWILRTFLGNRCPLITINFIDLFIDFILLLYLGRCYGEDETYNIML